MYIGASLGVSVPFHTSERLQAISASILPLMVKVQPICRVRNENHVVRFGPTGEDNRGPLPMVARSRIMPQATTAITPPNRSVTACTRRLPEQLSLGRQGECSLHDLPCL
jgi:hypothetical protein